MSAPILTLKLPAIEAVPLAEQLPVGRLVEIARVPSGAQMTLAVACVRQAMMQGSPVGWVQPQGGALFPPDLADSGVDLDALLVVHVPLRALHSGLVKSAELLLRSGGFGLVVIDLNDCESEAQEREPSLPLPLQSRLLGLAR
jgi:recombination protein RecA